MASSTGTPAARGSGVGYFPSFRVTWSAASIEVIRYSQRALYSTHITSYNTFTETKPVVMILYSSVPLYLEHAECDYEAVECRCCPVMPALSVKCRSLSFSLPILLATEENFLSFLDNAQKVSIRTTHEFQP